MMVHFNGLSQEPVEYRLRINTELDISGIDTLDTELIWIMHTSNYPNDSLRKEQSYYKKTVFKANGDTIYHIDYKENEYYENQIILSEKVVKTTSTNGNDLNLTIYNRYYNKKGKLMLKEKESKYILVN
jgi:hypothetical protein